MDLIEKMKELGGYWEYAGGRYLAELTSGKVSDKFLNTGVLTCRPKPLANAVEHLIHKKCPDATEDVDTVAVRNFDKKPYVCGPAFGGITLAYEVARQLGGTAIFTEPVYKTVTTFDMEGDDYPRTVKDGQALKRFKIPEGATVLFVEDVITSGKSTLEMMNAVWATQGDKLFENLPYVLCLVNRSGKDHLWPIISLADVAAITWDTIEQAREDLSVVYGKVAASDMTAIRPKDNWGLLTGKE